MARGAHALLHVPRTEAARVAEILRALPAGAIGGAIGEADGWTVILPEASLRGGARRAKRGLRLLTFTAPMGWSVVGFLARVTGALAAIRVPVLAVSTFDRDHLLVRASDRRKAVAALRPLLRASRRP